MYRIPSKFLYYNINVYIHGRENIKINANLCKLGFKVCVNSKFHVAPCI